ncbi:MAG: hypothetical protein KDA75_17800, partial [Planctomycetaceae bacterium]|nr:hypothetical protein [Planctomycetaceae bacterium]
MKTTGYRNLVAVVATLALVTSDVYGGYVVPLSKLGINAPIERREGPFATHEEAAEWARNWIRSLPPNEYKTYSIIETDDGIAADVAERITGINAGLKQIRETARNSGVATEIPAAGNVTAGYAGAVEIAYGNAKAAQDALTELAEDAPEDLLQSANRLIQEMTASETESYLLEQERHLQQLATDVASTIAESSSARLALLKGNC